MLIFFLIIQVSFGQSNLLSNKSIYIVYRATKNKQNTIAKNFNIKDSLMTHVGLGLVNAGKLEIYNVSNVKKSNNESALLKESLEDAKASGIKLSYYLVNCDLQETWDLSNYDLNFN